MEHQHHFQETKQQQRDSWQRVYSAGVVTINYIVYTHSNTQTKVTSVVVVVFNSLPFCVNKLLYYVNFKIYLTRLFGIKRVPNDRV